MKRILTLSLLPLAMLAADGAQSSKKTAKKTLPVKAQPAPTAMTVPKDATEIAPYTWSYTDAKGAKWIYRQTPFGISRMEDKPAVAPVETATPVTVTDLGDTFRFQRITPFGPQTWTKKKTELNAEEKAFASQQSAEKL